MTDVDMSPSTAPLAQDDAADAAPDANTAANATAMDDDAATAPHTLVNAAPVTLPGAVRAPPGAAVHMTERQLYAFRQQVAAYAHICQQLLQITAVHATQQRATSTAAGTATTALYAPSARVAGVASNGDPYGHANRLGGRGEDKNARGPRWTGTPEHYKALEDLFLGGQQPPVREQLTEITEMLTKYGPIAESNVYNWFQKRRSREKRKIAEERFAEEEARRNA